MLNFLKSVRRGSANAAPGAAPVATALARVPDGLTVENDVLIGANDRLYIYQGAHKIWDQARGARPIPQEAVNAFDANLRSRRAACERRKIPWCHLLAPDKQTIAHADYPLDEVHSVGRTIDASARDCLWPADHLGANDYYLTDSHWCPSGQVIVAGLLLERWGLDRAVLDARDLPGRMKIRGFHGDLGVKLDPKRKERVAMLPPNPKISRASNGIEKTGNEGIVEVLTNRDPCVRQTLLAFGDSFTRVMLPVLSEIFEVVVFCRTRYLHPEVLDMVRPDVCLTQNLERYFATTDADENAVPFFMVPHHKGRSPVYTPESLDIVTAAFSHGSPRHAALLERLR
ncbi:hypothetical protein ATO8_00400 [Roseivivax marinus]|uniref:AlgX/AlgJ SGNH hydrolase-like domain-containing protein n=1 Tax=Roseivivax marinus TaxID=1379903 RepID=W4HPG9_9RHOB|nr:hypothetical protein [Roseivivax marinus]ETW14323.1 hypothetical protein ATO8_00400 [Roseivivax marinus]